MVVGLGTDKEIITNAEYVSTPGKKLDHKYLLHPEDKNQSDFGEAMEVQNKSYATQLRENVKSVAKRAARLKSDAAFRESENKKNNAREKERYKKSKSLGLIKSSVLQYNSDRGYTDVHSNLPGFSTM